MIGQDPAFLSALSDVRTAAPSDSSVVFEGETGAGKEVLAQFLHRLSARANGPLVPIHCGSLTDTLFQSELFGYERGAFTGALGERPGRIEQANGGTLFLDDVCDLSASMQLALLRLLQERTFQRVGGTVSRSVDLRVACASNRPLKQEVTEGRFRPDLYFRLNVIHVEIPPLRERQADILLLAREFLHRHCRELGKDLNGFDADARHALLAYPWPGNVRELLNVIERAAVFCTTRLITLEDLPMSIRFDPRTGNQRRSPTWREMQVQSLRRVLLKNNGNRHATARELDIDRGTLYGMIKRFGLQRVGVNQGNPSG